MRAWATWREDVGGVAGLAAVVVAAWLGVVNPSTRARTEGDRLQVETDLLRSQVAMVQTQHRTIQEDLLRLGGIRRSVHPLRPREDFNRVLASLNEVAVASQITLDRALPGSVDHLPEVSRYRLSLSGRGTYSGAVTFLRAVRDRFPDVTVTVVSALSSGAEGKDGAMLSFELAWHAQAEGNASRLP